MKASTWLSTLIACFGLASSGAGADNTWKNSPDGTFQWGGFNWDSPAAWVDGDNAIFGPMGIGAIQLGAPVTAHNLTFNSPGYSLSGNTLTSAGTTPTITAAADVSINSGLRGTDGLTFQGPGFVTLLSNNTYTGGTYVRSGTLILRSAGVNGTTTWAVDRIEAIDAGATVQIGTLNNGSDLDGGTSNIRPPDGQLQRGNTVGRLNLTGGTFDNNGDNNGINYPAPEGTGIIINSSPYQRAVVKISKNDGGTYVFNGQIKDGGVTITKTNGGPGYQQNVDMQGGNIKLILGGSNSFTGFMRLSSGSQTLILTNNGTLGYAAPINCPSRQILMNSGTIDLNGTSQKVGYVFTGNGSDSRITNSAFGTVSTLTAGYNCTNLVAFNGAATPRGIRAGLYDDPATGGTLALTKDGPCIQPVGVYTGDGSPLPFNYHGDTTVLDGILQVLSVGGISSNSTYRLSTTKGTLNLSYVGTASVRGLVIDGVAKPNGLYNSSTVPITGTGSIFVDDQKFRVTKIEVDQQAGLSLTWDSAPNATYRIELSTTLIPTA